MYLRLLNQLVQVQKDYSIKQNVEPAMTNFFSAATEQFFCLFTSVFPISWGLDGAPVGDFECSRRSLCMPAPDAPPDDNDSVFSWPRTLDPVGLGRRRNHYTAAAPFTV